MRNDSDAQPGTDLEGFASPRIVLVAGVPRSGSTWVFNAARLAARAGGLETYATWIGDYDPARRMALHVVKAHRPDDIDFEPDIVLTTWRDRAECIASLVRMNWLKYEREAIGRVWKYHDSLYEYWDARSRLETPYDMIGSRPDLAVRGIAGVLGLDLASEQCRMIAAALQDLRAPASGSYDPVTLLHPRHRNRPGSSEPGPEDIRRLIGGDNLGRGAGSAG
ncbi:hypothetical protein [Litorisediminicola beolgyonensis]|uniref:Sulfotransferase family protein n=1 Tax=Litorisediminicola beolgyonensis TaxID=1173614 RepID=A0ABW3ZMZ1_9RHOB